MTSIFFALYISVIGLWSKSNTWKRFKEIWEHFKQLIWIWTLWTLYAQFGGVSLYR